MTIDQKIAQTLILAVTPSKAKDAKDAVVNYNIGGIVIIDSHDDKIFNKNYFDDINKLAGGVKLLVAVDQEGGWVQRFDALPILCDVPSAKTMGMMTAIEVESLGSSTGAALKYLGITTNLAPVLDIDNGINAISQCERSFSNNVDVIIAKAGAFAKGLQSSGINPVFKHFPGHGNASGSLNSDFEVVTTPELEYLSNNDLIPYRKLINKYGAAVMLGNLLVPGLTEANTPSSLSANTVRFLRKDYFYKGLIISDNLSSNSISGLGFKTTESAVCAALSAGVDAPMFIFTNESEIKSIINAVKAHVPLDKINSAAANMISFKNSFSILS